MNDLTTSSFYSRTNPQAIGSPVLEEHGEIDRANVLPQHAVAPPFARYADSGVQSFAPSFVTDDTFQPEIPSDAPQVVGPPMLSLPLIAAGIFALWLIFKGND